MPNKVNSWGLIMNWHMESLLLSPDRLWALQSFLQPVLRALLLHEAHHLPESSAKTKSGCSFENSSLWDDTM